MWSNNIELDIRGKSDGLYPEEGIIGFSNVTDAFSFVILTKSSPEVILLSILGDVHCGEVLSS